MKIAVYGVSAAGKDHLISELVAYVASVGSGAGLTHVHGSSTLDDIAMRECGRLFAQLDETERRCVRERFANELCRCELEYGNVVVDGHYAFPVDDGSFADVFTDADLAAYDLFFYLDAEPALVAERLRTQGRPMDEQDVRRWQDHEVDGLTTKLLENDKELHVIRNDGAQTLRYMEEAMRGRWSSREVAKTAVSELDLPGGSGVVCLVDCDKTLVEEDTTTLLLNGHGVDASDLADIYRRDRYTNYQCFSARLWLDANLTIGEGDVDRDCREVTMNRELLASLSSRQDIPVVAVTAGPVEVWGPLIKRLGVTAELLNTGGVMSKYVKYHVVRELQTSGYFVVAVGDSMLDSLMLAYADRSYLYSGKGRREPVARLLEECPHVRQFSFGAYLYPGTPADDSICWVDCLDQRLPDVASDIAVCKSTSGTMGSRLRSAHRRLGVLLGRRVSTCLPGEKLAVVIMMRSGLPLGEGVADELDCPVLFFDGDERQLVEQVTELGADVDRLLLVDGVVNTGRSIEGLAGVLAGHRLAVVANVVSSTARIELVCPVFAARVSDNSYVGAKQWSVSDGKGPDTADRLFRTM